MTTTTKGTNMNYTRKGLVGMAMMALAMGAGRVGAADESENLVNPDLKPPQRPTPMELLLTPAYKVPTMRERGTTNYHSSGRGRPASQPKRRRLFRGISRTVSGRRK